ncbi:MAG: maturation protein [Sanya fiers-like virus 20]|nr:MAG: maturation protein [Sanya fiers-like virus 20]
MSRTDCNNGKSGYDSYSVEYIGRNASGRITSYSYLTYTNPNLWTWRQIRSGTTTPNFGRLKRKRQRLPYNPFSYSEWGRTNLKGKFTQIQPPDLRGDGSQLTINIYGAYTGGGSPWESTASNMTTQLSTARSECEGLAIQRCLQDIKTDNVQLGVIIAEFHKTANMVADTATRLAHAMLSLRHGNLAGFADSIGITVSRRATKKFSGTMRYSRRPNEVAANTWLEYSYGWVPLLSDVNDSVRYLASLNLRPLIREAKGSATRYIDEQKVVLYGSANLKLDYLAMVHTKTQVRYKVTAELLSNASLAGLTNPAAVFWELLPYSFVVDWFIPIGTWLENLDATSGLSFDSGYSSWFQRSHLYGTGGPVRTDTAGNVNILSGGGDVFSVDFTRNTLSDFPQWRFPSFKNPLSATHVASAIALLHQAFDRRR